jgi:hypothetical protein
MIAPPWLVRWLLGRKAGRTEARATFLARLISLATLALLAAALWLVGSWWLARDDVAQARQDTRSAAALAETAKDAAATVIAQADREDTVDDLVAAAIEEIDNAPNDQAAAAAARSAICGMPDYRGDPAC